MHLTRVKCPLFTITINSLTLTFQRTSQQSNTRRTQLVTRHASSLLTTDGEVKRIHSAPAWVSYQNHPRGTSSSSWKRTDVGWTAMFSDSWLAWTPPNPSTKSAASLSLTSCLTIPSPSLSLLSETQVIT